MLLVVHNLPSHITYNDVKILVRTKCYIDDIILDKLTKDGPTSKKVTIGVAKDDDAFKIMEGLNGTFVEGQQISVEDVRKSSTDQSAGWNNPTQSQATDYMNNLNAWNMQMYQYGMQGYGYGMQGNTQGMGTQYPGYGVTGTAGIPSLMQSGYMAYGNQQGQLPQGQYGLQQPILGSKDSGSKSRSPTRGYDSGSAQKGYSSQQFQKNDVGYQTDKPIAGYGSNAHNRFGNQSITDQSERGSQSWGNNRFSGGKDGSRDVVGRKRPHSPDRNERDTRSFGDSRGSGGLGGNQSRGFERSHGKGLDGNQGRLDDESWERGLGGNQARDDDESWGKGLGGNQNRGFDSNPRGKGFGGGLGSSGGLGSGGLGGNQSKGFDRNPRGKGFGGLGSSGGLGSGGLGGNQSRGFDSSLGKGLGANQSRGFDNYHRGKGLGGCLGSSGGLGSGGLGGNQGRGLESSFGKGLGGNQRGFDNDSREKGLGGLGSSGGLGSGGLGGNHGRSLESSFGKGLGGKQRGFDNDTRGKGLGGGLGSSGGLGSGGLGGNQSRGFESSLLKGLGANQRVPETESWGTGLGGNQNRSDLRLGGEQGWYEDTRGNFGGNPNRSFETDHGNAFGNQGKGFANNSGVSTRDNQKPGKPLSKSENPYSWNSKYNPPKNAALNNPPRSSSTNFVPPSNASKPVNPLPSQSFGKPPEKRAKTDVEPNKVLPTDDNMGKQRHLTWRGMAIAYIAKAIIRQYVKAGHKQKYGKDCLAVLKTAIGNQMEVIFKRKFPENPFPEMREADIVQLYRTVHPFYQDIQLLKKEFAPARTFADNPCPSKKKKKNKTRTRKGALIGNAGPPPIANVAVKKPEAEFKKPTLADLLPPSVRQAQNQPNMNAYPKSKNKPPKKLDPIQLEKQAKRERKLLHKTEFLDPSLHKCKTPLMESALNSVLDELTDVYIKAIEDYETKDQNEKVVGNAIINKTTTEFRTTVRLHTVKRVLNETSTLMLRLFINGGKAPKTEVERVMQPFGINYMKSSKTSKFPMLMALVDSYETYDKLCAHPGVPCNGRRGPVLITAKPLHLTIPMKFRRLLRSKKLDEPDDDEVDFEDNPDDFDDDDVIEVVQPEPDVIELSGDEKPINTSVTTDDGNNDDANDEKNDDVIAITNVTGDSQNNSDVIAITNAKDDGKNDSIVIEDDKNFNDKECEVNTVDLTINDDVTEETDDKNVEADEIGDGLVEIDHDVVGEDDLEDY